MKQMTANKRRLSISIGTLLGVILAITALLTGNSIHQPSANAQAKADPNAQGKELVTTLEDIEFLRSMAPLKLSAAQCDDLVKAIEAAKTDYETKVNAPNQDSIKSLLEEARNVKKDALKGTAIPKTFDDKVNKWQEEFIKKREGLNRENILRVAKDTRAVLTPEQLKTAVSLAEDALKQAGNKTKATEEQLYNQYTVSIFIGNPRVVTLLKEIKAAQ